METEKDFQGDLPGAARPETTARRWRRGLVAGAGAALLLFTVTGFDRSLAHPAAAPSTGEAAAVEPVATSFEPPFQPETRVAFGPPPMVGASSAAPASAGERRTRLEAELDAFYRHRDGAPAWIEDGRDGAAAGALLDALAAAGRHGLDPEDYRVAELSARVAAARERRLAGREAAALDLDLSAAYLAFAADLCCGRLEGLPAAEPWGRRGGLPDLAASLEQALAAGPAGALADLAPPFPEYRSLTAALTRYRWIESAGGWPAVPAGPAPRPGEAADPARMIALAERLRAERYLSLEDAARLYRGWTGEGASLDGTVRYEEPLVGAVRSFQERHGLRPDAELGEATLAALNVPAAERARQVAVNLERWRWVPRDLGERHIRVNVAGFELSAFEDGREVLTMPVVVGTREWETPLFAEEIRWLEINPYWHVPASIARREILPKAAEDPSYLAGNSYQLVDRATGETIDPATADLGSLAEQGFRVRQSPGRGNALGRVKFIFPNPHNVYLHDTPQRSGFARSGRALSHGCVRVERPLELAGFVLGGDPEWDPERVRSAIDSGRSRRIDLERPLPVYLLYWTVFEDAQGRLHFRPDVYGHDQRIAESLAGVDADRLAARGGAQGNDRTAEVADPGAGDAIGAAG